jgi:hypothetical protein
MLIYTYTNIKTDSLSDCAGAHELELDTFNPSGLREAFEDTAGVMKTRVVGVAVIVGVVVDARANSHSPPSLRAACAKLLKTPWKL